MCTRRSEAFCLYAARLVLHPRCWPQTAPTLAVPPDRAPGRASAGSTEPPFFGIQCKDIETVAASNELGSELGSILIRHPWTRLGLVFYVQRQRGWTLRRVTYPQLGRAASKGVQACGRSSVNNSEVDEAVSAESRPGGQTAALEEMLRVRAPALLDRKPVDQYIRLLDDASGDSYFQTSAEVEGWCAEILASFGPEVAGLYQKLTLSTLIQCFPSRTRQSRYPESARAMFAQEFRAIDADMARKAAGKYLLSNGEFRKDLAICRQRLIPCGVVTVDVDAGIPRSWLLRGSTASGVRLANFVFLKLGGFRPLYEMHLHARALLEFTPAGWEACYRRIGELMQTDPAIRGVFGTSWWYDPKAAEVTPRLSFLRDTPLAHGARFFFLGSDEGTTRDALANAPDRRRQYEAGTYKPTRYLMIWRRDDLLRWTGTR